MTEISLMRLNTEAPATALFSARTDSVISASLVATKRMIGWESTDVGKIGNSFTMSVVRNQVAWRLLLK